MIHEGTDLKFKVTVNVPGFTLTNNDYSIVVKNRWGQVKYIIGAEDMIIDSNGDHYFTLVDVPRGSYFAVFMAMREDSNFESGIQSIVDRQPLCTVGMCDCNESRAHVCPTDGIQVAYQRVWTVNINGLVYLAEEDGTPILDANGNKIYFKNEDSVEDAGVRLNMTGAEVKNLLEGRSDNGKIDTVPEIMDALGGVDDETAMSLMNDEDTDDMINRVLK